MILKKATVGSVSTNTYLLIDEATGKGALVDCPCDCSELDAMLKAPEMKSLEYILFTHGHYDHILGGHKIKAETGAKTIIHEQDAPCLTNPQISLAQYRGCEQTPFECDKALRGGEKIQLGELEIAVLHTPGHTLGGCCYLVQDVMFSGDTLFYETVGRTDLSGGSMAVLNNSLERLNALKGDYKVLPGHGMTTTLEHEKKNNPYMSKFKEQK